MNSNLRVGYFHSEYSSPKTMTVSVSSLFPDLTGKDVVLTAYRKKDLIDRETVASVTTSVLSVDGQAPSGSLNELDGWKNIIDGIDLTNCPYNKYNILLKKANDDSYDIIIRVIDDNDISENDVQLSSVNTAGHRAVELFYDNVGTLVDNFNEGDVITEHSAFWLKYFGDDDFLSDYGTTFIKQSEFETEKQLSEFISEEMENSITSVDDWDVVDTANIFFDDDYAKTYFYNQVGYEGRRKPTYFSFAIRNKDNEGVLYRKGYNFLSGQDVNNEKVTYTLNDYKNLVNRGFFEEYELASDINFVGWNDLSINSEFGFFLRNNYLYFTGKNHNSEETYFQIVTTSKNDFQKVFVNKNFGVSSTRRMPTNLHSGYTIDSSGRLYSLNGSLNGVTQVSNLANITDLSIGLGFTVAISDGKLYAFGANDIGQCGVGHTAPSVSSFTQIGSENTWSSVSCGKDYTFSINDGRLYCWGNVGMNLLNINGIDEDIFVADFPIRVGDMTGIDKVYCFNRYDLEKGIVYVLREGNVYSVETDPVVKYTQLTFDGTWKELSGIVDCEFNIENNSVNYGGSFDDVVVPFALQGIRNRFEDINAQTEDGSVINKNKYISFGNIVLSNDIDSHFNDEILIERKYEYGAGAELKNIEFFETSATSSNLSEPQRVIIKPELNNESNEDSYKDEVLQLDNILSAFSLDYLQEELLICCNIKDESEYGPKIGMRNQVVYFNEPLMLTSTKNSTYISSSDTLAIVPFYIVDKGTGDKKNDLDRVIFNKSRIKFMEDGTEYVEFTDEDFDYSYNVTENNYTVSVPFGKSPNSSPEGYELIGAIIPESSNGLYIDTGRTINGHSIFKHIANEFYIKYSYNYDTFIVSNNDASSDGTLFFRTTNSYSEERGYNFSNYNWTTDYYGNGSGSVFFEYAPEVEEKGDKTLTIILYDRYGNRTSEIEPLSIIVTIAPDTFSGISFNIVGCSGHSKYTGFYLDNARLMPSNYVTLKMYAESELPFQYQITGDVRASDQFINFVGGGIKSQVVELDVSNETDSILGIDKNITVVLRFRDEAENIREVQKTIRYISNLHRFPVKNLLLDSESYNTEINRVSGNLTTRVPRRRISTMEYQRAWNDMFYPSNHSYPLDENGLIDIKEAIRVSQDTVDPAGRTGPTHEELLIYDKLDLDGDNLRVDNEGRYHTIWNPNKSYGNMANAYAQADGTGLTYFVIDNGNNIDFRLEFEHFDFDTAITKLPRNVLSPYDGDVLVVYDASDPDAVDEIVDLQGNTSYKLKDTTKLKELFAFTGSGIGGTIRMIGSGDGSVHLDGNGFVTPPITTTSRVCLIPFSDSTGVGSGFKLKGSPRYNVEYSNYSLDEKNGEVWVHESPPALNADWHGADKVKSTGKNYTSTSVVDNEKGIITFSDRQILPVLTNCTNYDYLFTDGTNLLPQDFFTNEPIKHFMTYQDDLVDYNDVQISVVPTGIVADYEALYDEVGGVGDFGKIIRGYSINKDLGLIEFTGRVPYGRLLANYYYHTYYRLTNDGYGDLFFYDPSLVPDSQVAMYTDWTYVDLKLINEGGNTLTNGQLKFLTRGYVSASGTVDRVLNNNRPWDVQIGTDAETVNVTGGIAQTQHSTFESPSRRAALTARGNQSVAFGTLLPKGITYVRVYWCLSENEAGTSFVETTRGRKLYSAELSGLYYTLTTG